MWYAYIHPDHKLFQHRRSAVGGGEGTKLSALKANAAYDVIQSRGVPHAFHSPSKTSLQSRLSDRVSEMEGTTLLHNIRRGPKLNTPVLVISKLIGIAIPIAEVVIGSLYLQKCPVQKYIPIYLVVMGAFTLSLTLLSCLPCTREPEDGGQTVLSSICTAWNSLVSLFLFCWFIAGNVWIYKIYQPNYVPGTEPYCDKTLYLFAFWITSLVYILIGGFFVVGCCALIILAACKRASFGYHHEDI